MVSIISAQFNRAAQLYWLKQPLLTTKPLTIGQFFINIFFIGASIGIFLS